MISKTKFVSVKNPTKVRRRKRKKANLLTKSPEYGEVLKIITIRAPREIRKVEMMANRYLLIDYFKFKRGIIFCSKLFS